MHTTRIDILETGIGRGYQSAVSLHAHTWHSKESLEFLPGWMARTPVLRTLFSRELRQYREERGYDLDFGRAFWRPPMRPAAVCESEAMQIARTLSLQPMVSLSDHDSIEAGLSLQAAPMSIETPVSTEWTVPFDGATFHIGVHNLDPQLAPGFARAMNEYSARPDVVALADLLSGLAAMPDVLVVLNHPLWNGDVNGRQAAASLDRFLIRYGAWIHALELNGYRQWSENDLVLELGRRWDLPLVAGGDRHGRVPNALLNLSGAHCFAEFVDEIRNDRRSHIVIMPEYLDHGLREFGAVSDILGSDAAAPPDARHWSQRIFIDDGGGGERPLVGEWDGAAPYWIRLVIGALRLTTTRPLRPVVRLAAAGGYARLF